MNHPAGGRVSMLMFDTVNGLPVHVLVLHAVVVGVPVMSLVTIAFVARPRWRPGLPWAVAGNVLVLGATFVTKEAGERLWARLGLQGPEITDHAEKGDQMVNFAIGLLVASVVAWLLVRRNSYQPSGGALAVAGLLVVVAGAAASFWVYQVGDSGATTVWKDTIANTTAPAGG